MMDFVKRHVFLLGLAAGVFVIATGMFVVTYVSYVRANSLLESQLDSATRRAKSLSQGNLYNADAVAKLKEQADLRKTRYEDILKHVAKMGHDRKVLVKGVLPSTTEASLLHSFKAEYDAALDRFMKRLGAISPPPAEASEAQSRARSDEVERAVMFAHPRVSFFRPDWVEKREAPDLEQVRCGQENIWLMEDVVEKIARLNDDFIGKQPRNIKNAAVKELVEIQIGAERAMLESGGAPVGSTRYFITAPSAAPGARDPSLTGRASSKGFYVVLPFRVAVVADARAFGELVRRLRGTESFITVEGLLVEPLTETSFAKVRGLQAASLSEYGSAGVVRLTLTCESLVFQLPEGRVTTPPDVLKAAQAAAKTEEGAETKPGKAAPPKAR